MFAVGPELPGLSLWLNLNKKIGFECSYFYEDILYPVKDLDKIQFGVISDQIASTQISLLESNLHYKQRIYKHLKLDVRMGVGFRKYVFGYFYRIRTWELGVERMEPKHDVGAVVGTGLQYYPFTSERFWLGYSYNFQFFKEYSTQSVSFSIGIQLIKANNAKK